MQVIGTRDGEGTAESFAPNLLVRIARLEGSKFCDFCPPGQRRRIFIQTKHMIQLPPSTQITDAWLYPMLYQANKNDPCAVFTLVDTLRLSDPGITEQEERLIHYKKYSPRAPRPAGTALRLSGTALKMVNFGSRSSWSDMIDATFPQR